MHKKFEIKGSGQSGRKGVIHNSKSDLPLAILLEHMHKKFEINRTKFIGISQKSSISFQKLLIKKKLSIISKSYQ